MNSSSYISGSPALGFNKGKTSPLGGLGGAGGTNRRVMGGLDSAHEEHEDACLFLKQGRLILHCWLTGFL